MRRLGLSLALCLMPVLGHAQGKGETLAGGPKQYDAKQTLASLKGKIG